MRTHLLVAVCAFGSVSIAAADPVVLAVDGKDIYVDLGAKDGVGAGAELELLHEVVVKDPRTGATLRDRFALGTLAVAKSGDHLSVAHADPELAKRVLAGDQVRLVSAPRKFVDPWASQVEASRAVEPLPAPGTGPGGADHAELARQAWQDTLGQPPEKRIERWGALVAADPKSPYRKLVDNEVASLRAQISERDAALARARSGREGDRGPRIEALAASLATSALERNAVVLIAPIVRAIHEHPIELAFVVRAPREIGQAWLYVRPAGDPGFKRIPLVPDGDAYLRATIDATLVRAPSLQWYVEAQDRTGAGEVTPVLGSQQQPREITVEDSVAEAPIAEGRSHVDAHVDYVDFDGNLSRGFDQYYQAEIDFTYRFIEPVYAVRLGFGTMSGTGGPKDIIDADKTHRCLDDQGIYRCKNVDFNYVYTEVEYRIRPNVAVMIRPQAGLLTTDAMEGTATGRCRGNSVRGCDFSTGFGARGRLRLGTETGTNLVLGAGFTAGVGTLLEAAYHWLPSRYVPVQLTVQVTDQPVPEDYGVRLIGDVGLARLGWFYPSLRVSYQARDLDHAGFSGGFAMNFDW